MKKKRLKPNFQTALEILAFVLFVVIVGFGGEGVDILYWPVTLAFAATVALFCRVINCLDKHGSYPSED